MLFSKPKAKLFLSLPSSLQEVMVISVLFSSLNSVVLGDDDQDKQSTLTIYFPTTAAGGKFHGLGI